MEIDDRDTAVIVRRAIDGDESSYKALYFKYAKAMYNICIRLLNNKGDAEDVLQESFITAFKKLKELKEASAFGGWLRRIVINNCHQHGRKGMLSFEELDSSEHLVDDDINWINEVPIAEVHFAIRNLPNGCRTIFLLYTGEKFTHKDIAERLGIAESTSKSQYLRAKKLLQQQLKKDMDNWKKYMLDNEENFSIEEVDDKVWNNVYKAAVPKKGFIKRIRIALEDLFKKWEIRTERYTAKRRYSKFKLAYASVFVAFIIFSCTYKVKSYSKYGDMVTFALAKSSYLMINEHSKSLFNSFSSIISPSDSSSILFLKLIKKNDPETKKIIRNLKVTKGVSDLAITPVEFEFKESLFSSFVNKAFDVQINTVKPDVKQIKNKIEDVLKEKGLSSINIQIDDKEKDVLFSSKNIHQNELSEPGILVIPKMDSIPKTKPGSEHLDIKMPKIDIPNFKNDLALMNELTNALERDGLVDNRKPYKLEIKDGELYINGKKQTKDVSDKYRKYFRNDNYTIQNDGDQKTSASNQSRSFNFNDKPKAHSDLPKWDPEQWKREMKLMNLLIDGLVKEGLINRNGPYTVQIKDGELIINNQKQPKEISDKMRPFFYSNNYGFMND